MAKKNPFEDDKDDAGAVADKAAVESLKEKVAEARGSQEQPEEIAVDLDQVEEELDQPGETRETRNEKKRNRYREVQERQAAAERERDEARKEAQQMRELMLQMRQQPQQQERKPDADPLDEELEKVFREQELLLREFNAARNNLSASEYEDFNRRNRALQRKVVVLGGKMAMREEGVARGQNPEQVRQAVIAEQLMREHGDVLRDERKQMYCDGVWRQLRAKGKPDDWDTMMEAAEETRKFFGMPLKRRAPPPSESYKRKLSGAVRGGAPTGEGRVVTMNKQTQAMADAMYRHIKDPDKRRKLWAATAGRRGLERRG